MITPPRAEGTVKVGRSLGRLGFAEFGPADGRPLVWLCTASPERVVKAAGRGPVPLCRRARSKAHCLPDDS
jgi:hypothetical protein